MDSKRANSQEAVRRFLGISDPKYPQIDDDDLIKIFHTRVLLLKKGKFFGHTVVRWAFAGKNGKLAYYKSLSSLSP